jgi:predicted acetyltransferase
MFLEMKDGGAEVRIILETSPENLGKLSVTFDSGRRKIFVFDSDYEAERERKRLCDSLPGVEQKAL